MPTALHCKRWLVARYLVTRDQLSGWCPVVAGGVVDFDGSWHRDRVTGYRLVRLVAKRRSSPVQLEKPRRPSPVDRLLRSSFDPVLYRQNDFAVGARLHHRLVRSRRFGKRQFPADDRVQRATGQAGHDRGVDFAQVGLGSVE